MHRTVRIWFYLFISIIVNISHASELLINNVTLISAERAKPLSGANILIKNGRISEVSTSKILATNNPIILDGSGKYLIPGLTDSHVHTSDMPGFPKEPEQQTKLKHLQDAFIKQQPRNYLYFGITQILDPAQTSESIKPFNQAPEKPDLFHCGAVPVMGGYPTMFFDHGKVMEVFDYIVFDETNAAGFPAGIDPLQHTPEAIVKRIADSGAICVKAFIEDGFGANNEWPLISNKVLTRLNQAASKHGLLFMAHANAVDMQEIAQQVSVDIMAHGMWNWNQFDGQKKLPQTIQNILDDIIVKQTTFQATLNVMDSLKGVTVDNLLQGELYKKMIPANIYQWYHTKEAKWFRDELLKEYGELPLHLVHQRYDQVISQGERVVQYLDSQNYPLVLASDTPPAPTYASQPGLSSFNELRRLHQIGVSLSRVFEAATLNNAKALFLDQDYGTIEPGKVANLLLLETSPLKNIEAYNTIDKVILHGKVIERSSLTAN